jgi:hypothetical protein
MAKGELFITEVPDIFDKYLAAYPPGSLFLGGILLLPTVTHAELPEYGRAFAGVINLAAGVCDPYEHLSHLIDPDQDMDIAVTQWMFRYATGL